MVSVQKTCPGEEEIAASSEYNPGDPSVHVVCPFAAWSLCRVSRRSSVEPEPQRDRPQPHALLGDEEVGRENLVNVTRAFPETLYSAATRSLTKLWAGLLPESESALGNVS